MLLSRRVFWVAALVATVALTSIAQAQPGGGGRGGRGGFGGGFGGGGFGGGGFGGQSTFSLIGRESVQKDLALDADHIAKAKALAEKYGTATREEFQKIGGFPQVNRDTPEEERNAKMKEWGEKAAAANKVVVDKLQPELDELLTDEQATRLEQIRVQALGGGAINDPVVAKALAITEEQKTKFASIREEYQKKGNELASAAGFGRGPGGGNGGDGGDREAARAKFTKFQEDQAKLREEQTKATADVLTAEQKEKLTALKGKEFDVASLRGGFGGPGGGRGPGGPGGGRPRGEGRPKAE